MTQRKIAETIGVTERTARREIAMGKVIQKDSVWRDKEGYKADYAQMIHDKRGKHKGKDLKIGKNHELANLLEKKLL